MRGVKGCFVCGQLHRENDKPPRDEVTVAINKLKDRLPTVLLTVSDMDYEVDLYTQDNQGTDGNDEIAAEWAEEGGDSQTDDSLAFMATKDLTAIERTLSSSYFLH